MFSELRLTLRALARSPLFTATVLILLTVSVGATAASVVVLDAVVFHPLPYASAEQLVRIRSLMPRLMRDTAHVAQAQYRFLQSQNRSFSSLGLYSLDPVTIGPTGLSSGHAEVATAASVTASLLTTLAVRPQLGGTLTADDNAVPDPGVAMLTDEFWADHFGRSASVVGRMVSIDGHQVRIVGVLPRSTKLPEELPGPNAVHVDLWIPTWLDPALDEQAGSHTLRVIARLQPRVTLTAAAADMARLTVALPAALPAAYPVSFMRESAFAIVVTALRQEVVGWAGSQSWLLFGAAGLLLVIVCVNVTNLYVARLRVRRRDMTIRAALGASAPRLALQLLTEVGLTIAIAGLLAVPFSTAALRMLAAASPLVPSDIGTRLPLTGLACILVISVVLGSTLVVTMRRATRPAMADLHDAGHGVTMSKQQQFARRTLAVTELALSLMLVSTALLFLQSAANLKAIQPGFADAGVITFGVTLPEPSYHDANAAMAFYRALGTRLGALPRVRAIGMTTALPLDGFDGCSGITIADHPLQPGEESPCVPIRFVTPGYLEALSIPVRGKSPEWADIGNALGRAVVSTTFANRYWPAQDPVGKTLQLDSRIFQVIGIAGAVRSNGLDRPSPTDVYLLPIPGAQPSARALRHLYVAVGSDADNLANLEAALANTVASVDRGVPVSMVRPLTGLIDASIARTSLSARLMGAAAIVATILSAIGLFGLISYLVVERRAEIGIRIALGASTRQIATAVVGEAVVLSIVGIGIGLVAFVVVSRGLQHLLFHVGATAPLPLVVVSIFLLIVSIVASAVPARRAMHVDPIETIRR